MPAQAWTLNVYDVPFVKPVITHESETAGLAI
jgi:hypothetical protein